MNTETAEQKGFTLVEILVVVAIIAVLAAILSSSIMYGIRSAKVSACANNLGQIQTGLSMYLADNDGTFPIDALNDSEAHWLPPNHTPAPLYKYPSSRDYIRNMKEYGLPASIFRCPLDTLFGTKPVNGWCLGLEGCSRQYSSYMGSWDSYREYPAPKTVYHEAAIPDPSATFTFSDMLLPGHDAWPAFPVSLSAHGKTMNIAFLDGHVKSLPCNFIFHKNGVTWVSQGR